MYSRTERKKQAPPNPQLEMLIALYAKASGSMAFIQSLFIKLLDELKGVQD